MAATGKSITDFAEEHGYTKQAFYDVIKGRTKTKHLRELISQTTGKSEAELWPDDQAAIAEAIGRPVDEVFPPETKEAA